jgi:hypothetical protein
MVMAFDVGQSSDNPVPKFKRSDDQEIIKQIEGLLGELTDTAAMKCSLIF